MGPQRTTNPLSVLFIGPATEHRDRLLAQLQKVPGWELDMAAAGDPTSALDAMGKSARDLVFLEYPLEAADALGLLAQIRQLYPRAAVVAVTPGADERVAVQIMKNGALDYLRYGDLHDADLASMLRRVVEIRYLIDQNAELRQVNQMKNEFIANVSHELRTPLSVIIGYAESLKTGGLGAISQPQVRALESITGRAEELLRTLNQILRIGEGQPKLTLKPLDLRALAVAVSGRPNRELSRKNMKIECELPAGPIWVRADEEKLSVVLENLLSNAAKFGPPGSTVKLEIRSKAARAVLEVSDAGPGIPQEMMPRLFEQFGAAGHGPTREHAGLGLGLPLSKRIVEQHSGRIWLESKDRRGCMAVVSLPIAMPDSPPMAVTAGPSLDKKRVLIVEDNPEIVDVLLLYMSSISGNLELSAASSGFEALDSIKDKTPDLIILDVVMPGMDGYEVLDRLRRSPTTARIPVLVLTGYTDAAQKAIASGAQEVLLKPFERKTFCDKVLVMLRPEPEAADAPPPKKTGRAS